MSYISYSGWKLLDDCDLAYWRRYIDKTPAPEADNKVNSLYGSSIGLVFETFYNEGVWRKDDPVEELLNIVEPATRKVVQDILRKEGQQSVRWDDPKANYKSFASLVKDVRKAVPAGVETIRSHTLVGREAGAEIKLDHAFGRRGEHILGGRADFIIRRARHGDLAIIDGKGSKYRDQYVDARQLLWYAMLWKRKHGYLPDVLGFLFWRSEPAKAVDWVAFTEPDLNDLEETVLAAVDSVDARRGSSEPLKVFPAKPGKACRFCSYRPICPEGMEALALTQRSGVRVELPLTPDGSDVEEVGL